MLEIIEVACNIFAGSPPAYLSRKALGFIPSNTHVLAFAAEKDAYANATPSMRCIAIG
jgi:hypothetical protein